MPSLGVETQIQQQVDFLAAYRMAIRQAVARRQGLWRLIHDANDPLYETRVLGRSVLVLDARLADPPVGTLLGPWAAAHSDYFRLDLQMAGGWSDYLAACRWRVAEEVAELLGEGGVAPLPAACVYPSSSRDLGSLERSRDVFHAGIVRPSVGTATTVGPGQIAVIVPEGTEIGGEGLTVAATLATVGGLRVAVAAIVRGKAGTTAVLGRVPLAEDSVGAGSRNVLRVESPGVFVPGLLVLVADDLGGEWATVAAVAPDQTITFAQALRHEFRKDQNASVTPLADSVVAATCQGSGADGDRVFFRFSPDRPAHLSAVTSGV